MCRCLASVTAVDGGAKLASVRVFTSMKHRTSLIPADQVDFAAIMRNAEIRRHESVAQTLQIEERLGLAAFAQSEMLRSS